MFDPHPRYAGLPAKVDRAKILAFLDDIGIDIKDGAGIVSVELGIWDVTVKRIGRLESGAPVSNRAEHDVIHIGIGRDASDAEVTE